MNAGSAAFSLITIPERTSPVISRTRIAATTPHHADTTRRVQRYTGTAVSETSVALTAFIEAEHSRHRVREPGGRDQGRVEERPAEGRASAEAQVPGRRKAPGNARVDVLVAEDLGSLKGPVHPEPSQHRAEDDGGQRQRRRVCAQEPQARESG